MAPRRTVNHQNRKPSPYRLPLLLLGAAGVLLLLLAVLLPVDGWKVLFIALALILLVILQRAVMDRRGGG